MSEPTTDPLRPLEHDGTTEGRDRAADDRATEIIDWLLPKGRG